MKILFLSTYPIDKGPSQRFRIGLYLPGLRKAGHEVRYIPYYDNGAWNIIFSKGNFVKKVSHLILGSWGRFKLFFSLHQWDVIFIQREVSPIGPPILGFYASKVLGKRVIYDIDDAIWIPNYTESNALFHRLKSYWKTRFFIKWSDITIAGNEHLALYAKQFNSNVILIPTIVDTDFHRTQRDRSEIINPVVIGWTGSISTLAHLKGINRILSKLQKSTPFELHVIANKSPDLFDLNYHFIPWTSGDEINSLDSFDIGIMPLPDDEWTKGKCGFKAIQYMSMGIATLASPVGMNKELLVHGVNGYLCTSDDDWQVYLHSLITNAQKRLQIGREGRRTIEQRYSLESQLKKMELVLSKKI